MPLCSAARAVCWCCCSMCFTYLFIFAVFTPSGLLICFVFCRGFTCLQYIAFEFLLLLLLLLLQHCFVCQLLVVCAVNGQLSCTVEYYCKCVRGILKFPFTHTYLHTSQNVYSYIHIYSIMTLTSNCMYLCVFLHAHTYVHISIRFVSNCS